MRIGEKSGTPLKLISAGPNRFCAGVGEEDAKDRFTMFLRCAAHADHHAGQMIYLCKQLGLDRP